MATNSSSTILSWLLGTLNDISEILIELSIFYSYFPYSLLPISSSRLLFLHNYTSVCIYLIFCSIYLIFCYFLSLSYVNFDLVSINYSFALWFFDYKSVSSFLENDNYDFNFINYLLKDKFYSFNFFNSSSCSLLLTIKHYLSYCNYALSISTYYN